MRSYLSFALLLGAALAMGSRVAGGQPARSAVTVVARSAVPLATTVPEWVTDPADVGMSSDALAAIDRAARHGVEAGGFPGAAVIVGRRGAVVFARGYGTRSWSDSTPVDPAHTIYDLASLTKVVATTTAAMVLVDRGVLDIDAPVARYLPEYRTPDRRAVTVRDLLTHRSGLPAGRDVTGSSSIGEARRALLATPLVRPPGERAEYSDVGPIILGFVIEKVAGEPLDVFLRKTVYRPIRMTSTTFHPGPASRRHVAPTAAASEGGVVHDPTARALGGVAGNAGLFSTAADLARLARLMLAGGALDGHRLVSDSTVALFTRRTAGWRALGWDTCAGGGSCGHYLGPTAYGHTGFTGTSLWIDPERELFVIVLTNAVLGRPGGGDAPVAILHDVREDIAEIAALAVTDDALDRAVPAKLRSDTRIGWQR